MVFIVKRLLVFILIPAAVVLLFLPLDISRSVVMERDFVFLTADFVAPDGIKTDEIVKITPEQLEPYPALSSYTCCLRTCRKRGGIII